MSKNLRGVDSIRRDYETPLESYIQNLTFKYYDLATQVFRWSGLKEYSIPERQPEKMLYETGMFCYISYNGVPMLLPTAPGSIMYNPYGEPSEWRAVAQGNMAGGINSIKLNSNNSVIVRNDFSRRPTRLMVKDYLKKIKDLEVAYRSQTNACKIPWFFEASDENVVQIKNQYKAMMDGDMMIVEGQPMTPMQVWYNTLPFILDKLSNEIKITHNDILNYIGIDNLPIEKKERLLTGEVEVNGEEINLMRASRLAERKRGEEIINELLIKDGFTTPITVELNPDIMPKESDNNDIPGNVSRTQNA